MLLVSLVSSVRNDTLCVYWLICVANGKWASISVALSRSTDRSKRLTALWSSVSCSRPLRHAARGSRDSNQRKNSRKHQANDVGFFLLSCRPERRGIALSSAFAVCVCALSSAGTRAAVHRLLFSSQMCANSTRLSTASPSEEDL